MSKLRVSCLDCEATFENCKPLLSDVLIAQLFARIHVERGHAVVNESEGPESYPVTPFEVARRDREARAVTS